MIRLPSVRRVAIACLLGCALLTPRAARADIPTPAIYRCSLDNAVEPGEECIEFESGAFERACTAYLASQGYCSRCTGQGTTHYYAIMCRAKGGPELRPDWEEACQALDAVRPPCKCSPRDPLCDDAPNCERNPKGAPSAAPSPMPSAAVSECPTDATRTTFLTKDPTDIVLPGGFRRHPLAVVGAGAVGMGVLIWALARHRRGVRAHARARRGSR